LQHYFVEGINKTSSPEDSLTAFIKSDLLLQFIIPYYFWYFPLDVATLKIAHCVWEN